MGPQLLISQHWGEAGEVQLQKMAEIDLNTKPKFLLLWGEVHFPPYSLEQRYLKIRFKNNWRDTENLGVQRVASPIYTKSARAERQHYFFLHNKRW